MGLQVAEIDNVNECATKYLLVGPYCLVADKRDSHADCRDSWESPLSPTCDGVCENIVRGQHRRYPGSDTPVAYPERLRRFRRFEALLFR